LAALPSKSFELAKATCSNTNACKTLGSKRLTLDENCVLPLRAVDDTLPPSGIVTSNRWIEVEFEPKTSPIAGLSGIAENLHDIGPPV
jgi:hypothetical protein